VITFANRRHARTKGQLTSDKYRNAANVFLTRIDARLDVFSAATYQQIVNVDKEFTLPLPGEQLRLRVQQSVSLLAIVLKMLDAHGYIDNLQIATYTLNRQAFLTLTDLLTKGRIRRIALFLSTSYGFRDKKFYAELQETVLRLQAHYEIFLIFAWLHLKITLVQCGDNYYQMEGSMNYSMNNMAEQILIENNADTYRHDTAFFRTAFSETANPRFIRVGRSF
jgi:hypothetical protein